MSIVEPDRSPTKKFLSVVCPCGRGLRASVEMAGQEISCWECHRMVRVPVPRSPEQAFRLIRDVLEGMFEGRWLILVALLATLLTSVLCVKGIGALLATGVLVIGAISYGELIRQCGIKVWDFDDWMQP